MLQKYVLCEFSCLCSAQQRCFELRDVRRGISRNYFETIVLVIRHIIMALLLLFKIILSYYYAIVLLRYGIITLSYYYAIVLLFKMTQQ